MTQSRKITYGPLVLALLLWGIAGGEIYKRAAIELNGTVASSETHCMQPANNRCGTHYVVEGRDGSRAAYASGPTDGSLPTGLPIGTAIAKSKWALSYSINGRRVDDFPVRVYCGVLVFGLILGVWWYSVTRHNV